MIGYPAKYYEKIREPFLSPGRIIKINQEFITYDIETDNGSSGSPVCIVNKNNKLKLIGIHTSHNTEEKKIIMKIFYLDLY